MGREMLTERGDVDLDEDIEVLGRLIKKVIF